MRINVLSTVGVRGPVGSASRVLGGAFVLLLFGVGYEGGARVRVSWLVMDRIQLTIVVHLPKDEMSDIQSTLPRAHTDAQVACGWT
jgi:hypothetical protein